MKSEQNLNVSKINRRPNSQLSDIKISLSPHEGKQNNPLPPQNTFTVITLLEDYLESSTSPEVEFVLIIIVHINPALPSSPLQLLAKINLMCLIAK